eukprot:s3127_g6.t1
MAPASSAVARSPENLPVPCSTQVEAVLGSVFRVWAVVTACVASFLFRSACILYLFCANKQFWPCALLLPYYLISEAAPGAMLILLYLLPGVEVACHARRARALPDRSSCRASLLESEAQTQQSFSLLYERGASDLYCHSMQAAYQRTRRSRRNQTNRFKRNGPKGGPVRRRRKPVLRFRSAGFCGHACFGSCCCKVSGSRARVHTARAGK